MTPPPRINVLGVGVHALQLDMAGNLILAAAHERRPGYVCCCDVNSVSSARRDPNHRSILNRSFLTTPDGMPVVWMAGRQAPGRVGRVYGPDLMLAVCAATVGSGFTHYFHGAGPGTAEALATRLTARFPGLKVAGTFTPPFSEPTEADFDATAERIRSVAPDFVWIGLSTPKQEALMAALLPRLDRGILLGVGAAFDLLSGRVRQAPHWVQRSGLEWLWRLMMEPRRLAPRYLRNNPLFLLRAFAQITGLKKYPQE